MFNIRTITFKDKVDRRCYSNTRFLKTGTSYKCFFVVSEMFVDRSVGGAGDYMKTLGVYCICLI